MTSATGRTLKTDLLCIGGSGAGVMSATTAAKQGLQVLLISKGRVGYSGNAVMAGGGFSIDGQSGAEVLGYDDVDKTFTRDKMFDCIVKESFFVADQNIVQQYVDESGPALKDYVSWVEHGNFKITRTNRPCGWYSSGLEFTKALAQGVRETGGIQVLEDVTVVEILTSDGVCCGALAIDLYSGEIITIKAKAVVIGTGGYQPFSLKNTVSDMTGDGPAMAYRVGAGLSDMEFLLSFPTAVVPHDMRGSIYPFMLQSGMPNLRYTVSGAGGIAAGGLGAKAEAGVAFDHRLNSAGFTTEHFVGGVAVGAGGVFGVYWGVETVEDLRGPGFSFGFSIAGIGIELEWTNPNSKWPTGFEVGIGGKGKIGAYTSYGETQVWKREPVMERDLDEVAREYGFEVQTDRSRYFTEKDFTVLPSGDIVPGRQRAFGLPLE